PLAVGLGIYLPTSTTLMVVVGALVGAWFDKRADRGPKAEATKQLGVLLASGLIVGESLLGVLVAALVAFSDKLGFADRNAPLALVGDNFHDAAIWIGGVLFVAVTWAMYRWIGRMGRAV
ncbi:MAG TPA: OPT/YSL family transporter, partial [Rhodanobacter sp.]|nr:OPT/YSL family transporter [Rhodanobacter sp.]